VVELQARVVSLPPGKARLRRRMGVVSARVLVPLVVLVAPLTAGCMGDTSNPEPSSPQADTHLEIEYWPQGVGQESLHSTLDCPPDAQLRACRLLASARDDLFAPVPKDVACSEIYGGPQVAEIRGTFRGRPVNARFNRTNGCEIERWERIRFLLPD
jgi:hypothetical protein